MPFKSVAPMPGFIIENDLTKLESLPQELQELMIRSLIRTAEGNLDFRQALGFFNSSKGLSKNYYSFLLFVFHREITATHSENHFNWLLTNLHAPAPDPDTLLHLKLIPLGEALIKSLATLLTRATPSVKINLLVAAIYYLNSPLIHKDSDTFKHKSELLEILKDQLLKSLQHGTNPPLFLQWIRHPRFATFFTDNDLFSSWLKTIYVAGPRTANFVTANFDFVQAHLGADGDAQTLSTVFSDYLWPALEGHEKMRFISMHPEFTHLQRKEHRGELLDLARSYEPQNTDFDALDIPELLQRLRQYHFKEIYKMIVEELLLQQDNRLTDGWLEGEAQRTIEEINIEFINQLQMVDFSENPGGNLKNMLRNFFIFRSYPLLMRDLRSLLILIYFDNQALINEYNRNGYPEGLIANDCSHPYSEFLYVLLELGLNPNLPLNTHTRTHQHKNLWQAIWMQRFSKGIGTIDRKDSLTYRTGSEGEKYYLAYHPNTYASTTELGNTSHLALHDLYTGHDICFYSSPFKFLNPNETNGENNTVLHLACATNYTGRHSTPRMQYLNVIRFLLNHPFLNIAAQNCYGETALHLALERERSGVDNVLNVNANFHPETIRMLLSEICIRVNEITIENVLTHPLLIKNNQNIRALSIIHQEAWIAAFNDPASAEVLATLQSLIALVEQLDRPQLQESIPRPNNKSTSLITLFYRSILYGTTDATSLPSSIPSTAIPLNEVNHSHTQLHNRLVAGLQTLKRQMQAQPELVVEAVENMRVAYEPQWRAGLVIS